MAEGNGAIFNNAKEQMLLGLFHLSSDTIKVIMVTSWSPTVDGEIVLATFTGVTEESGTGYNVGGETLGSKAVTQDDTNNWGKFTGADITWTGLNIGTPGHAVMYSDTHASKAAIAYWELGRASNGSDYKIAWNANGIITLT
jgi:hypothetical protein